MTATAEKTRRQVERFVMSLPVRVEAHDIQNKIWRELTHLETVSYRGAGFYLSRVFGVGQLVLLTLPLPKELRRYDFDEEQYAIWGIVRHCHRKLRGNSSVYHVGVAFIGPQPPYSYRKNPQTSYQFFQVRDDGLWEVCEDARTPSTRAQLRYNISVEIFLAVYDAQDTVVAHEKTVTENISASGISVFSQLPLNTGDAVKVIKQDGGFSATAVVRHRRIGDDNLPRLHLEFVDARFPLEGID